MIDEEFIVTPEIKEWALGMVDMLMHNGIWTLRSLPRLSYRFDKENKTLIGSLDGSFAFYEEDIHQKNIKTFNAIGWKVLPPSLRE